MRVRRKRGGLGLRLRWRRHVQWGRPAQGASCFDGREVQSRGFFAAERGDVDSRAAKGQADPAALAAYQGLGRGGHGARARARKAVTGGCHARPPWRQRRAGSHRDVRVVGAGDVRVPVSHHRRRVGAGAGSGEGAEDVGEGSVAVQGSSGRSQGARDGMK